MRTRLLMSLVALLGVSFLSLHGGDAPNAEVAPKVVDAFVLADRLQERVSLKDWDNTPLREVIEFLNEKHDLCILVDNKFEPQGALAALPNQRGHFVALRAPEPAILDSGITLKRIRNLRLETVLSQVCKQIDATYLVYTDHIQIVPLGSVASLIFQGELEADGIEPRVRYPLVTLKFQNRPLMQAFSELSERTNVTIVVAPQVAEKAKVNISAKFQNTPIDNAITMLAELGEFKMVRRGNDYLITTPERAKLLAPSPVDQQWGMWNVKPVDPNPLATELTRLLVGERPSDELKKKVEELTTRIVELEKKK